jgi:hypothetical protein
MTKTTLLAATLALLAPALAAREAAAQTTPSCNDTTMFPNGLYLTGSTDVQPVLPALASAVSQPGQPVTLIFQAIDSCSAITRVTAGTAMVGTATAYVAGASAAVACTFPSGGSPASVGVSEIFASTCGLTLSGVGDFPGPVVADEFVVPKTSSQAAISAKAAYFVFGFGAAGMVSPWTDETVLFIRTTVSGIEQRMGAAIHVPVAKWKGMTDSSSNMLLSNVAGSTKPEATLGILTAPFVDANRDKINQLAYRDYLFAENVEQRCAFLPDSSMGSKDKRNVRDGHYPLWGYLHLITPIISGGLPATAQSASLVNLFNATSPNAAPVISSMSTNGLVPACAMHVSRTSEAGAFASFSPTQPCGCSFEYTANGAAAPGCVACTSDASCTGGGKCRFGFCESN